MANKPIIPELLLKLSNVYKEDMYIINSMYTIGGITSENQAIGKCYCVLEKDKACEIKDYFGDIPVIYISNIKKAKEFFSTEFEYQYIQTKLEPKQVKEVIEKQVELSLAIERIKTWNQFHFTEEQIIALIKDNGSGLHFRLHSLRYNTRTTHRFRCLRCPVSA